MLKKMMTAVCIAAMLGISSVSLADDNDQKSCPLAQANSAAQKANCPKQKALTEACNVLGIELKSVPTSVEVAVDDDDQKKSKSKSSRRIRLNPSIKKSSSGDGAGVVVDLLVEDDKGNRTKRRVQSSDKTRKSTAVWRSKDDQGNTMVFEFEGKGDGKGMKYFVQGEGKNVKDFTVDGKKILIYNKDGSKYLVDGEADGKGIWIAGDGDFKAYGNVIVQGDHGKDHKVILRKADDDKKGDKKTVKKRVVIAGDHGGKLPKEALEALKKHGIDIKDLHLEMKSAGDGKQSRRIRIHRHDDAHKHDDDKKHRHLHWQHKQEGHEHSPSDLRIEINKEKLHGELMKKLHGALKEHHGKLSDEHRKKIHEAIKKSLSKKGGKSGDAEAHVEVIVEDGKGKQTKERRIYKVELDGSKSDLHLPHLHAKGAHGVIQLQDGGKQRVLLQRKGDHDIHVVPHIVMRDAKEAKDLAVRLKKAGGNSSASDMSRLEKRLMSIEKKLDELIKVLRHRR